MSERDKLALELFIGDNNNQPRESSIADWEYFRAEDKFHGRIEHYKAMAECAINAGYRKPRTITTAEELDALPDDSVLMSGDRIRMYEGAIWRVRDGFVERVGRELRGVTPFRYFVDPLPATVLYEPDPTT